MIDNHIDAAIKRLKETRSKAAKEAGEIWRDSCEKDLLLRQVKSFDTLLKLAQEMKELHNQNIKALYESDRTKPLFE